MKHGQHESQGASPLEPVLVLVALVGALLSFCGFALGTPRAGVSVTLGALVAIGNLWALAKIVSALFAPSEPDITASRESAEGGDSGAHGDSETRENAGASRTNRRGAQLAWAAFAVAKMAVLFGGVYVLLERGLVEGIPLAFGYTSMPIGIFLSAVWASLRGMARAR